MVRKNEFSKSNESEYNEENPEIKSYDNEVKTYFRKIGITPTYKNRKKVAEQLGIQSYIGTKEQNKQLVHRLKIGRDKK